MQEEGIRLPSCSLTAPPEFENLLGEGFETNVVGTYNVLASSAVEGVKRVIIASSSSVYGQLSTPAYEYDIQERLSNFYPLSRKINEITALLFKNYGLETVFLRYFNTYGIGENSKGSYSSVIWKFIESMKMGKRPMIFGDGSQRRGFVYVEDTARASIMAMKKGVSGEAYNIGTGVSTEFNTIFQIIKEELNYDGIPEYIPNSLRSYRCSPELT